MKSSDHLEDSSQGASGDQFKRDVGTAAHDAVARLCRIHANSERDDAFIWGLATDVLPAKSLGSRTRVGRLMVAAAASVYERYFLPTSSWKMVGSELAVEPDGRIDLAWEHDSGAILYDELKLGSAFGRPDATSQARRQAARYSSHGASEHGSLFAGVRLILLGAPRHSVLVGPGAHIVPLWSSAYWFERSEDVR